MLAFFYRVEPQFFKTAARPDLIEASVLTGLQERKTRAFRIEGATDLLPRSLCVDHRIEYEVNEFRPGA